jgi:hypothetical protein
MDRAARADFRCTVCQRGEVHRFDAAPHHCGRLMDLHELLVEEDQYGVHLLERTSEAECETTPVALRFPPPPRPWPRAPIVEWAVLMIPRGRTRWIDEPVGWIAQHALGYAYQMPVGVPMGEGFAPDLEHAVRWVLSLIDGGVHNNARVRDEQQKGAA